MKRLFVFALSVLQIFALPITSHGAEEIQSHQWYCVHEEEHRQPTIDKNLAFIEECGGYYVDHKHRDPNAADKVVYLTFDAGYENEHLIKILDVMKEEEVTGAFFVLKHLVVGSTDLVKRMADEGHLVCNHTMNHPNMSKKNDMDFLTELRGLEDLYMEQTGCELARFYRPPQGVFSKENLLCAKENGYKTIFWSFAYPDWDNQKQLPPEKATKIVLENLHNGEVMLLHPTSATNAAILGDVIRQLKEQGYRFGTLEELTSSIEPR